MQCTCKNNVSYYLATQLVSFLEAHCCRKYLPVSGLSWAQEHSWPGASIGHIVTTPWALHTSHSAPGSAGSTQQLKTLPLLEESRWTGSGGWVLLDNDHGVPPVRLLHLLVVHHHRGRGAPRRRPRPRQDLPGLPRPRPHPLLLRTQPGLPAARLQGGHRIQGE